MPIGILCVKLLELRVGSSRRSSGTALKWWLLDPSPALNSILTLSLLSHICPGHQPRCTIPVNPFKLFEASGREQDVNVSCCEISFIFYQPSSLRRVKYIDSDALRITWHEHCTLEVELTYWIRWSVPLFCVQLTSLSWNRTLGLLSNACALTTGLIVIITRLLHVPRWH